MRISIAIGLFCCMLFFSAKTGVYVKLTGTFKTYTPADSGMVFAEAFIHSKNSSTVIVRVDSSGNNVFYDSAVVGTVFPDTAMANSRTYKYYVHKGDTLKARCITGDSVMLWVLF